MQIEYLTDRPDLIDELAGLLHDEWGFLHPGQTQAKRAARLARACGRGTVPTTVVATDGGELLGSAALAAEDMDTRVDLTPWLAGVYVKATHRRRGVATRLVERIEHEAALLTVPRLYLYSEKEEAFYARRGWQLIERCRYHSIEVAVMFKAMAATA